MLNHNLYLGPCQALTRELAVEIVDDWKQAVNHFRKKFHNIFAMVMMTLNAPLNKVTSQPAQSQQ